MRLIRKFIKTLSEGGLPRYRYKYTLVRVWQANDGQKTITREGFDNYTRCKECYFNHGADWIDIQGFKSWENWWEANTDQKDLFQQKVIRW